MSERNTLLRSLHDVGLAAWFGGSLMGAVGLNAVAGVVADPRQRSRVASAGWSSWTPVNAAAIGAHVLGAAGMLLANRDRVRNQQGVGASSAVKTAVTGIALGVTAYSRIAGKKMSDAGDVPVQSGTEPNSRRRPTSRRRSASFGSCSGRSRLRRESSWSSPLCKASSSAQTSRLAAGSRKPLNASPAADEATRGAIGEEPSHDDIAAPGCAGSGHRHG